MTSIEAGSEVEFQTASEDELLENTPIGRFIKKENPTGDPYAYLKFRISKGCVEAYDGGGWGVPNSFQWKHLFSVYFLNIKRTIASFRKSSGCGKLKHPDYSEHCIKLREEGWNLALETLLKHFEGRDTL